MGGQTALNTALALHGPPARWKYGVEMIGAKAEVIDKAEDRQKFRDAMDKLGLGAPAPRPPTRWKRRWTGWSSSACPPSSARRSHWPAPAAASPTTARSSRRSSCAASTCRRPPKC
ncbi:hypothetical protein GMDG_09051 [Pseudogymnoascus destructans 20631-21]|uniref:Uncharacterized protein n=1 Tax=Pseudogymnoascus destructans (strain ATCC MYA-4855 / 20631-21) TaxID=658429 RepID=L8FU87_PSED2|nr:hypothetical protein GMDG_09051 [Pseudogymnoascus destructans 20631-21]